MTLQKIDKSIILFGIFCLTVLESIALFNGINGTMFTMITAVIAATIGVIVPRPGFIKNLKGKED